ncbi:hypothetical protein HPT27_04625 [Permianibacter sp. IMCC34836]|uniref:hypothetical protein n=1 Tax=Permianibacter fluminis TaxID=2738515 RepID=UPI0015567815|nr:hypothetical protein [Permianibacter fluminis]NQD36300.1 hypothetical protein [Permianibacter fluminis]
MASTKLELLLQVWQRLLHSFEEIDSDELRTLSESWERSLLQINQLLTAPEARGARSSLITGLEQGLREIPVFLSKLNPAIRPVAVQTYNRIVNECLDGFFEKDAQSLEKIIKRGRLVNEREWSLVRHWIDLREGDETCQATLLLFYKLIDEYEAKKSV